MLEAVIAQSQCVQVALNTHAAHLLPCLHRVHRSPAICITVYKEHRCGAEVEAEFGDQYCAVGITPCGVVGVATNPQYYEDELTAYSKVNSTLNEYAMYALNGTMTAEEAMLEAAAIADEAIESER